jgi:hypothetical protein
VITLPLEANENGDENFYSFVLRFVAVNPLKPKGGKDVKVDNPPQKIYKIDIMVLLF